MALKVGQLRRISEELKLNLPPKVKKKELRRQISAWLNIKSAKNSQKISNLAETPKSKDQSEPWSPPKAFPNSSSLSPVIIRNRNPEKGVRIIKMSDVNEVYGECTGRNNYKI